MQMLNKTRYSLFGFNYTYKSKLENTLKQIPNVCSKQIGVLNKLKYVLPLIIYF